MVTHHDRNASRAAQLGLFYGREAFRVVDFVGTLKLYDVF
jgi:hypothetical protein